MKRPIIKIGFLALCAAFVFSLVGCANTFSSQSSILAHEKKLTKPINDQVQDKEADNTQDVPYDTSKEPDYIHEARAVNPDVIGWITVPNTSIHYPILETNDNEFYLDHNLEKEISKSGAVFLDMLNNDPNQQKHLMIYGHNMKDGSMFHDLNNFKKKDFFRHAEPITIWLWGEQRIYDVYAQSLPSTDLDFRQTEFDSDEAYVNYLQAMRALSKHQQDNIELDQNSEIVTLVTCTYEYDDLRCLVQGVQVS